MIVLAAMFLGVLCLVGAGLLQSDAVWIASQIWFATGVILARIERRR